MTTDSGSSGFPMFNGSANVATAAFSSFSATATSLVLIMGVTLLCYLFNENKAKSKAKQLKNSPVLPPGPKPWPVVGNLPEMLKNKPAFRWMHNMMDEMNTEIACIRLGNFHVIPVTSPEISREFLKKQDSVFASRPYTMASELTSRGYLGTVLGPMGDQLKKMKKVLSTELFSTAKHRWLHNKRVEEADHLVRYVYNQCKTQGGLVDIRFTAQHYCGNFIRKIMFNKRFFGEAMKDGGPGFEDKEHLNALFTILAFVYSFCISDYVPFLRRRLDVDGHEKIMREATNTIHKYHDPIIEERIQQWTKHGANMEADDLLDVLICLKDDDGNQLLSAEEISCQMMELVLAAVDNPSNAFEWALAEMLNKPEMLQKAVEELDRVVGKERLVQEYDFPKLNYVKACAREAFRLHPIAAFNLPHVAVSDAVVAGYFIPKDSHVLLSRMGLGRNPRVWDEPMKFMPERHLGKDDEVSLAEPDLRFISFSTGRRGCMAVPLGSSLTVMLFARLLHAFTWSLPSNLSSADLSESDDSLVLATPLFAVAKPRLHKSAYPG